MLQFQFHRALCKKAGYTGPLHECSIYGNKEAGEAFKTMLALGASKPWQDALFDADRRARDGRDRDPRVLRAAAEVARGAEQGPDSAAGDTLGVLMRPLSVIVVGLGACFTKPEPSPAAHDAMQVDGAPDALACATFGLWSTPTIVPGINAASLDDHMAALSPDGSLLVFSSQRTGTGDLYVTRFDPSMASPVTVIASLTTATEETEPAWSADGTQLYFKRGAQFMVSDVDLTIYPPFKAPRPATDLMPLGLINRPRFSPDGLEVFFSMNSPEEIFRSTRAVGGGWQAPALVTEIAAPGSRQFDPIVSGDGRTLYFVSNRIEQCPRALPGHAARSELVVWIAGPRPQRGHAPSRDLS